MRFTQFGHQVPRRNSTITIPCARKLDREKLPSRLAAASENSGARDPIPKVSVTFFTRIDSKVRAPAEQEPKQQANQQRHGFVGVARAPSPAKPVLRKTSGSRIFLRDVRRSPSLIAPVIYNRQSRRTNKGRTHAYNEYC
jgi:hypothetical protein